MSFGFEIHQIVGFGLESFRVSTKTIRLIALVFFANRYALIFGCYILIYFLKRESHACTYTLMDSLTDDRRRYFKTLVEGSYKFNRLKT